MFRKKTFWMMMFSLLGLIDAAYLTYVHFNLDKSGCSIDGGCNAVLTSSYSEILGIPTALFGVLYYLGIFGLVFLSIQLKKGRLFYYAKRLTIAGLLTSLVLIYLQTQVIGSLCPFCMTSAVISTLLFLIGYYDFFKRI
ncbi:vitamin K epoxide reductase family protein [Patescibacteria group bacterium]